MLTQRSPPASDAESPMIERDRNGDVTVLRMCHGTASALDPDFLDASASSPEAEASNNAAAVVLTGTGSIFFRMTRDAIRRDAVAPARRTTS